MFVFIIWSALKNRSRNGLLSEIIQIPVGARGKMWVLYNINVFNEKSLTMLTACTYRKSQANLLRGMREVRKLGRSICVQQKTASYYLVDKKKLLTRDGVVIPGCETRACTGENWVRKVLWLQRGSSVEMLWRRWGVVGVLWVLPYTVCN